MTLLEKAKITKNLRVGIETFFNKGGHNIDKVLVVLDMLFMIRYNEN